MLYQWNAESWRKFVNHPLYLNAEDGDMFRTPSLISDTLGDRIFETTDNLSNFLHQKNISLSPVMQEILNYSTEMDVEEESTYSFLHEYVYDQ